jgi:restriction system protein
MRQIPREMPTFDALMLPMIRALQILGGSGSIDEINAKVYEIVRLPNEILDVPHLDTTNSEVSYRLAWGRTYLKKYGLIGNSARGVWSIQSTNVDVGKLDPKEIVRYVREADKARAAKSQKPNATVAPPIDEVDDEEVLAWHQHLHKVILALHPSAFERLAQRLLRESGFIQVEVTGKSGDGGIDGIGIARINGFLSFHVLFQCKRYQGAISPSQIRDFRGAMQGRTDKGLFITTGTFTREAVKEATRDGAPPIDLIDGDQLVQRLKELGLGVNIQMVESVEVDKEWFDRI